jgi:hypothetical protein
MTAEKATVARQMYDSREHTVAAIAATVGVSRATIYRSLAVAHSAGKGELSRSQRPTDLQGE